VTATAEISTPRAAAARRGVRWARWIGRGVVALLVVALLVPFLTAGYVYVVGRQDDRTPTDAVIVLGAAQYWSRPSPVLEARLQHAQRLFDEGVARELLTVGGKQPGDVTTEAQAGRRWLVAEGVPAGQVTAVPTGADTLSSLTAAAEVMRSNGWESATLVTDPAHEARSLAIARALGIDARTSPTQEGAGSSMTFDYVARETAGLLMFWLVDRAAVTQVVGED
jgi:vancomycin permeability regulator SanA